MEQVASRTALGAALYRAAHQKTDRPILFEDPWALLILDPLSRDEAVSPESRYASKAAAPLRLFIALRSRFAEDCFREAYEKGVRQYVALGAGLDTFAYRQPYPDARVFEVDHPLTQAWKKERLDASGIPVPPSVTYVSVDFERQSFLDALGKSGLERSRPAFFSWLGVTPYLEKEVVRSSLSAVAEIQAVGSEMVFDARLEADGGTRSNLEERVRKAGEPFKSSFCWGELRRGLEENGYGRVECLGREDWTRRYGEAAAGSAPGHLVRAAL